MAIFWSFLVNVVIVLFVINGLIWLREKMNPSVPSEDRALFGTVTRGFGGADFIGAVLVVLTNIAGAFVSNAYAGGTAPDNAGLAEPASGGNLGMQLLVPVATLAANWVIIAWRNSRYLNWVWSGAAVFLIFSISVVFAVFLLLIGGR